MDNKKNKKVTVDYHKLFNRLMTIIAIIFLIVLLAKGYRPADDLIVNDNNNVTNSTTTSKEESKPDSTVNIAVVGDIMCHNTQYNAAKTGDTYDFSYVFDDVRDKLKNSDLTIGNLETTFAGKDKGYSSYPTFNTPDELGNALKDCGFDVLCTANNHSLDKGYNGITRTIEVLDNLGISHMGTYSSEESSNEILFKDVNGIKFAFLAYTYGTNGIAIPSGKEYCINLIDKDKIATDLKKAKEQGAEVICVNMHWGIEYNLKPTDEQKDLANFLFENGADLILGSHPHVLEPMEIRKITLADGSTKDGFLIYSLGNFVSGQVKENTNLSAIINIKLTRNGNTGKISIDNVSYTPTYVDSKINVADKRFAIIDINKHIENYNSGKADITKAFYDKLKLAKTNIDKYLDFKDNR